MPLLREVMTQFRLHVDDFDDETWASFVGAVFGNAFGRSGGAERLRAVVERVLNAKLERLRRREKES